MHGLRAAPEAQAGGARRGRRECRMAVRGRGAGRGRGREGRALRRQAGKLLDNMLAAIGLKRGENVYIANVVKCRPPGNRTPTPPEAQACEPYLLRQIAL